MKRLIPVLVAGLMLSAWVCRADDKPEPNPVMVNDQGTWFRADVRVTEADFGKTIAAPQGALVDVALAENVTTGYSWKCSWDPTAAITLVRSVAVGPTTQLVGAGGTRHFLLLVNQPVKTKITVQYGRWWDKGEREEPRTFVLDATAAVAPTVAADVTIHAADLGGTINLKVGQTAEIVLATNPSTGFSWKFTYDPPTTILEVVSDTYVQGKPIMPGRGGQRHVLLRAKQAGQCVITAQYQRPWDGGEKQAPKTLTVKVDQ